MNIPSPAANIRCALTRGKFIMYGALTDIYYSDNIYPNNIKGVNHANF